LTSPKILREMFSSMSTEEEEGYNTEFYANVGSALMSCQSGEKLLAFCLTHVFPDDPILSVEMLERIDEKNRKRMLGQLIGGLRELCRFSWGA
jgi:hypothetical protein